MSECAGVEAEPEPEETEQPPEEDKGGGMGIMLVVLLVAAAGGGAFYYFKTVSYTHLDVYKRQAWDRTT